MNSAQELFSRIGLSGLVPRPYHNTTSISIYPLTHPHTHHHPPPPSCQVRISTHSRTTVSPEYPSTPPVKLFVYPEEDSSSGSFLLKNLPRVTPSLAFLQTFQGPVLPGLSSFSHPPQKPLSLSHSSPQGQALNSHSSHLYKEARGSVTLSATLHPPSDTNLLKWPKTIARIIPIIAHTIRMLHITPS